MSATASPSSQFPKNISPENLTEVMVRTLDEIKSLAATFGVSLTAYSHYSLQIFKNLDTDTQLRHLKSVGTWRDSYREALGSGNVIRMESVDAMALHAAALKYGFIISEDFYARIRRGDVIELYTFHAMNQEWRNMEFLRLSSYDVLTLLLNSMDDLFYRDEEISKFIEKRLYELVADPRTKPCHIPEHAIFEKKHAHNKKFNILHEVYTPVRIVDGPIVGFVSTLRASPLGSLYDGVSNVRPLRP